MSVRIMDTKRVTRREMLGALGATGVVGLAGCANGDQTPAGTDTDTPTEGEMTPTDRSRSVKVGVLQPVSGSLKYYGQQSIWGFYEGFNFKSDSEFRADASTGTKTVTVGDVEYELVVRDTEISADTAQTKATDLVQNEGVDLLWGCTSSGVAGRVIQTVAKPANVPILIGPAASAGITSNSATCGESVFRTSENTAMDARSGGTYVAQNTDVSKVYLFGADYSFGRAVVRNYRNVLEAAGVEIVGEKFVERGYSEWPGLLDNAEEAGAEGIVAGFTVQTLPQLFTAFLNGDYSYRIFGGFATEITNGIVGDTLKKVLGEPLTKQKLKQSNLGPFTTRYHWNQYDNAINSAFRGSYIDNYGKVPDLFTSGTFAASSALVQAVEASGSTSGADIAAALRGMTIAETPKGQDAYVFQEYNNQARSEMTVANLVPTTDEWADNWGAAVMPGRPIERISGDQATIPADSPEMGCSL